MTPMPLMPLMWQVAQVGTNMSRVVRRLGRRVEIQQSLLRLEHHAVLGLFVDFDLRMVRAHVALGAGAGQARDAHRAGVAGVASGAVADGAVGVGLAYAVALLAAAGHGRAALRLHERMRRTARAAGLIGFREIHLLGSEAFFAVDGGPGRRGVAAVQELLINVFVATAAIARRQLGRR